MWKWVKIWTNWIKLLLCVTPSGVVLYIAFTQGMSLMRPWTERINYFPSWIVMNCHEYTFKMMSEMMLQNLWWWWLAKTRKQSSSEIVISIYNFQFILVLFVVTQSIKQWEANQNYSFWDFWPLRNVLVVQFCISHLNIVIA